MISIVHYVTILHHKAIWGGENWANETKYELCSRYRIDSQPVDLQSCHGCPLWMIRIVMTKWCFEPRFCTFKLHRHGEYQANEMTFSMNYAKGAGSICRPAVQHTTTLLLLPPPPGNRLRTFSAINMYIFSSIFHHIITLIITYKTF